MIKYEVQYHTKQNSEDWTTTTMRGYKKDLEAGKILGEAFKRVDVIESKIITETEMPWMKI